MKPNKARERFAEALLSTELSSPESSGSRWWIRAARFPGRKTPEEFDFTFQSNVRNLTVPRPRDSGLDDIASRERSNHRRRLRSPYLIVAFGAHCCGPR